MLRFKRSFQIGMSDSYTVESVRQKYRQQLNQLNLRTDPELYGFSFRRKFSPEYKSPGDTPDSPLSVFREGTINVYSGINTINIDWTVKLDILFFIAGLIGCIIGLGSGGIVKLPLYLSVIAGIGGAIGTVLIGIAMIMIKIDEMNDKCFMQGDENQS